MKHIQFTLFGLLNIIVINAIDKNIEEYELYKHLINIKLYNSKIRPNTPADVFMTMYLKQIISIEEKNQIMTSSSVLAVQWTDLRLAWNSSDWNDVIEILVPTNVIWAPDLFITNTGESSGYIPILPQSLALVSQSGVVYVVYSLTNQKTRCPINIRSYPFDTQHCSINIGALTADTTKLNLISTNYNFKSDSYIKHSLWDLTDVNVYDITTDDRFVFYNDETPGIDYFNNDVRFTSTLRRKPLYFMANNIFPTLILNCIVIVSYALPFTQQVGLSMTMMITYSVYSIRIASDMPVDSRYFPLVALFFLMSVGYTFLSLIWFIIATEWESKKNMPQFLIKVAIFMKHLLYWRFNEKPLWYKENKVEPKKESLDDNDLQQITPLDKQDDPILPESADIADKEEGHTDMDYDAKIEPIQDLTKSEDVKQDEKDLELEKAFENKIEPKEEFLKNLTEPPPEQFLFLSDACPNIIESLDVYKQDCFECGFCENCLKEKNLDSNEKIEPVKLECSNCGFCEKCLINKENEKAKKKRQRTA